MATGILSPERNGRLYTASIFNGADVESARVVSDCANINVFVKTDITNTIDAMLYMDFDIIVLFSDGE